MFNLNAFIHGLNIFNLTRGPMVDEVMIPDNTATQIANARLDTINRNANRDFFDEQEERVDNARKETRKITAAAIHVAADRLALQRTFVFLEKRLREGATPDQAFKEAEKYRASEYDKIQMDQEQQARFKNGLNSLSDDKSVVRNILVGGLPLLKKPRR